MKRLNLLLAVAALFLIAACSDDSTTSSTVTSNGEDITGSWYHGCVDEGTESSEVTVTFSGGTASYTFLSYQGSTTCSGDVFLTNAGTFSVTFTGTKTMANDGDATASTVDATDTSETVTPGTDTSTALLESINAYGVSDWTTGTAQQVLGTEQDGSTYTNFDFKTVIYVDDSASPNTVQFGMEEGDGGTPDSDGYPVDLEPELFEKQ